MLHLYFKMTIIKSLVNEHSNSKNYPLKTLIVSISILIKFYNLNVLEGVSEALITFPLF